jgi:hypothetical protein
MADRLRRKRVEVERPVCVCVQCSIKVGQTTLGRMRGMKPDAVVNRMWIYKMKETYFRLGLDHKNF